MNIKKQKQFPLVLIAALAVSIIGISSLYAVTYPCETESHEDCEEYCIGHEKCPPWPEDTENYQYAGFEDDICTYKIYKKVGANWVWVDEATDECDLSQQR
ncbi:hypothetical protein ACFL41_00585 [Gemmatimonadota bacterium]